MCYNKRKRWCEKLSDSKVYYDGTKLLSMKDINGNTPEIYICTTNRTGGKTTFFNRLCVNKFNEKKGKFCVLYRYISELDDCATKFFKDIGGLFFPNHNMTSKPRAKGIYHELYFDKNCCGYAIPLNAADKIKRYSHLFNDVERMLLDEFQSESNDYCADEVRKFRSIHTSIARGNGKMVRRVPVYLVGNPITLLNPYYVALGISNRLTDKVKFLKGTGFVLEQGYNEAASKAQAESAFNSAFIDEQFNDYLAQGVYLNDNLAFIEKMQGVSRYVCTLRYNDCDYAVREFANEGIMYCDDRADTTFANRISVTTNDHKINYVMLKKNDLFLLRLRFLFEHGAFRFKNLKCKEAVLKALSY